MITPVIELGVGAGLIGAFFLFLIIFFLIAGTTQGKYNMSGPVVWALSFIPLFGAGLMIAALLR